MSSYCVSLDAVKAEGLARIQKNGIPRGNSSRRRVPHNIRAIVGLGERATGDYKVTKSIGRLTTYIIMQVDDSIKCVGVGTTSLSGSQKRNRKRFISASTLAPSVQTRIRSDILQGSL